MLVASRVPAGQSLRGETNVENAIPVVRQGHYSTMSEAVIDAIREWQQKIETEIKNIDLQWDKLPDFMQHAINCTRLYRQHKNILLEPKPSNFFWDDFFRDTPFAFMISWNTSVHRVLQTRGIVGTQCCKTQICSLLQIQHLYVESVLKNEFDVI